LLISATEPEEHSPPAEGLQRVPVIGNDEAVQIKIEPVLHGGTVYLGDEPARLCQR
jgi:hypothetical protein